MFNLDNKLYKNIFLVPVLYTFGVSAIYIFVFDYSFKQVEAMTKNLSDSDVSPKTLRCNDTA